jgi:hypothetical protein
MSVPFISIEGIPVSRFLYGTTWKEEHTQSLTELALRTERSLRNNTSRDESMAFAQA